MAGDLESLVPDRVFDGGDMDCGSGLVLLIRENILAVPEGGVLEMRSREPTVRDDLPPWCRMAGHEYLGALDGAGFARYFVRRGTAAPEDAAALKADKEKAQAYEWRVRARSTGGLAAKVYCRNFSFETGQPASFEEKDRRPSAVEYLLGGLAADLAVGFATECSRSGLEVDDIEVTARGRLADVLAHFGVQAGDPSFAAIEVKGFASSLGDEAAIRAAWERTVMRSPIAATLRKAADVRFKLAVV